VPDEEPRRLCCDQDYEGLFDDKEARHDLDDWHQNGPPKSTADLIEAIRAEGVEGGSIIDIGAGVGILHVELLGAGLANAIDVDLSSAFLAAARTEAERRGIADRIEYRYGDAVEVVPHLRQVDVVTLDRVVCCYPDVGALLTAASGRATRLVGLVHPSDAWYLRAAVAVNNLFSTIFRRHHRFWTHRRREIDRIMDGAGFVPIHRGGSRVWRTALYRRA
jgi:2-polyprenyl-3-methyl-5-hydroxy-6-metoxy-1,4-benzoquinol methylase